IEFSVTGKKTFVNLPLDTSVIDNIESFAAEECSFSLSLGPPKKCPLWIPSAEMPMVSGFSGGGGPPQISQLKQKIQTGGSQKLAGSEPQNSIEIHSVLFEMRFFKKGAVFIFRKRALNWHCKVNMKK
ncbi:recombinase family protein, partial [Anaerotruncus colihominis]|nr:recombinase family protein [Anaerotruncus colihominis]